MPELQVTNYHQGNDDRRRLNQRRCVRLRHHVYGWNIPFNYPPIQQSSACAPGIILVKEAREAIMEP
jgi:hypothetical protein